MRDDRSHLALDEQQLDALWGGVDQRLGRRRRRRRAGVAIGAVLSMVAVVWVVGGTRIAGMWRSPVLHLASGADVPVRTDGALVEDLAFSDGSTVHLAPTARLELLENGAHGVGLALRQGTIDVHVQPGGERMWSIETRLATVQVVGTQFRVEHLDHAVHVSVTAGVVIVRGETVPGRVRRLQAGDEILVEEPVAAPVVVPMPHAPAAPRPAAPLRPVAPVVPATPVAPAKPPVTEDPPPTRASLMSRADQARRQGKIAEAVALYGEILTAWPHDPEAGVVAFTRARLQADDPAAAARGFEQALALGLPAALVEEAALQRFEEWRASGDISAARRAALDYLLHQPHGEARQRLRAWLLADK